MSNTMLFGIAIGVSSLLIIGVALTIAEFRHGEPRQQQKRAEQRDARSGEP
ncbi:MAG: hypothetical protein KGY48_12510 [Wenzhouxiangellaceae bacterium]|nr:hypothetical protein [Wenzhouxiangellaceae bacterium]MBS3747996.1 hypothetical protein [Wenzhouxiangellaceae bacterium]